MLYMIFAISFYAIEYYSYDFKLINCHGFQCMGDSSQKKDFIQKYLKESLLRELPILLKNRSN